MKIKSGLFAVYKGKEYRLAIPKDDELELLSSDASDMKNGFVKYSDGIFFLVVNKDDLDSYYDIDPMARYKGFDFGIWETDGDKILVWRDCDWRLAQKLGLEPQDKGIYGKWVKEEDLEKVWEEKSPLKL